MKLLLKKQVPYLLAFGALFYIIPFVYPLGVPKDFMITVLLVLNPALSLAISAVYGFKHRFKWYYLFFEPILFVPSAYLFYNDSALIYAAIYEFFCLLGLFLGVMMNKRATKL